MAPGIGTSRRVLLVRAALCMATVFWAQAVGAAPSQEDRTGAATYANLAAKEIRAKRYALAEQYYRKARKLDPGQPEIVYGFGRLLFLRGRLELAEREFLRFLSMAPGHELTGKARAHLEKIVTAQQARPNKGQPATSRRGPKSSAGAKRIATRKKEEKRKAALSSADKGGMEWVRIAGGTFSMGSDDGDSDEKPVHPVTVSSFEMAKSEVTVGQYGACVRAGKCTAPDTGEYCNWGKTGRTNHPVNCVEWSQAVAFSRWVGGRLPTEAEWEYAARSGGRSWRYPWGSSPVPDCRGVVMDDERTRGSAGSETDGCGHDRTWPVCSKSAGHSRQGLCDMLGNVWEWTGDWYGSYDSDASRDPKGATGGSHRVLRGCSWSNAAGGCRAANRFRDTPSRRGSYLGFRPSRSVP